MSKELIERLRRLATMSAYSDYKEAADRIEELERKVASRDAEVAELKGSLKLACEIREGTTIGEQRPTYWLQQMLMSRVTPLSDYQPPGEKVVKPKRSKDGCSTNVMRHEDTIEKYRSAWKEGDVWLQTQEIEKRLGMGRSVAYSTLNKWWKDYGLLDRREAGKAFNRKTGFEWKWK